MTANASGIAGHGHQTVQVAGFSLVFEPFRVPGQAPTGAELAAAAGFKNEQDTIVLEVLPNSELEDIRPDEVVDLRDSTRKFIIVESDRTHRLAIDGVRFDWPCRVISGGQLRKLGRVPAAREIYLDLECNTERVINEHDLVDLGGAGVEAFKTRERLWKFNVQGVVLTVREPEIVVRRAIKEAGFDPSKNWIIVLRVQGQPKKEVDLDYVVDLRTPGIEKLRLTPREVNNGEAVTTPRRMFALLEADERFLNDLGLYWETVLDKQRRWLLLYRYPVPAGFTVEHTLLALEIPPTYPGAQIDMFYTSPKLTLKSGRPIDRTQVSATILGAAFNGWSRHRGAQSPWNPANDNVATHLALVESAMTKEVGE